MTYLTTLHHLSTTSLHTTRCLIRNSSSSTRSRNSGWFHPSFLRSSFSSIINLNHPTIATRTIITQCTTANSTTTRRLTTSNNNNYGTPKTGLILPKKTLIDDQDTTTTPATTIGGSFQPTKTTTSIGRDSASASQSTVQHRNTSPLINVNQSNLSDFSHATLVSNTNDGDNTFFSSSSSSSSNNNIIGNINTINHENEIDSENNDVVTLDIASMYDPQIHLPNKPDFNDPNLRYEAGTPLGDELMRYVGASGRGGISVAEYMGRCLRDEQFGYYTNPPSYDDEDEEFGDGDDEDDEDDANDDVEGNKIDDNDDWDTIDNETNNTDETMFQTAGDDETTTTSAKPPPITEGRGHRIIGAAGDFTTAPEISQIFGECLTVWLLAQYETMGKPSKVQLVEIGPGRGTLICDVLRSARGIKGAGEDFVAALGAGDGDGGSTNMVSGLHLVEVSENLRAGQFEALEALELQMTKNNKRQPHNNNSRADDDSADDDDSISKRKSSSGLSFDLLKWKTKEEEQEEMEALVQKVRKRMDDQDEHEVDPTLFSEIMVDKKHKQKQGVEIGGTANEQGSIPVQWHSTFNSIPSSTAIPTFIIGQEILDALPVHVFQKTEDGWKERLIDVAIREDCDDGDSNNPTPPTPSSTVVTGASTESNTTTNKKPRFRYVLSPGTTPALRALLHVGDEERHPTSTDTGTNNTTLDSAPVGTVIEVCPEAMLLAQDITSRIEACNGAALLIDYGNEGSGDTLRAFRRHEQVDVLSRPGTVDITADVDFAALRDAVNVGMAKETRNNRNVDDDSVASNSNSNSNSSGVGIIKDDERNIPIAFGPVCQGQFLASMGAVERTMNLIEDENTTDEQAEELCTALERLVSEEEMGQRYKVMAIARKKSGIFPPPGF